MIYDYLEAITEDVREYVKNEIEYLDFDSIEDLESQLNEDLFNEDSITGNASGSYTFSIWEAEENLCHNMDLLKEACVEFGCDMGELVEKGAEDCDVTIRCYLLSQAIAEVMEEIEDDFEEVHEEANER